MDPGSLSNRGWVGPRAGLDIVEERRFYCPRSESNQVSSVFQRVASHCTGHDTPNSAHLTKMLKEILEEREIKVFSEKD